ncbi:MAG: UvrD-helicase domain-containing protein [Phycisphaeraceae bacterium]
MDENDLLSYGVPAEWLADVRTVTEETLFPLCEHLPKEAAEALLELATGGTPAIATPPAPDVSPFDHPDAQRRFRVMTNVEELQRALDYPWEQWTIFLHPAQRELVERDYNGPARVAGSAGTGKTIVALHRAVHLARKHPESRVLLTTYSQVLAGALRTRLIRLISNEPRLAERIEAHAIDEIGRRLHETLVRKVTIATQDRVREIMKGVVAASPGCTFSVNFLMTEWEQVVDAWQIKDQGDYLNASRLGRKRRLSANQRTNLWALMSKVYTKLTESGLTTQAAVFAQVTEKLAATKQSPFDYVVVDEAQDLNVPQLKFLAAMGNDRPNSLFFAGDLGQRIFQLPFSWKSLGVDVRGRSKTLRINYRTSHQIRVQTEQLLGKEIADVDGLVDDRRGTVSVFDGPRPTIATFESAAKESDAVGTWLRGHLEAGVEPHEIGVFVRSHDQMSRAAAAVEAVGAKHVELSDRVEGLRGHVAVGTMHRAKGLEFRVVVVMACDDEVIPLQPRIEEATDDSDLAEIYATERHLLYVACTRARDDLMVTGVQPASEFLSDLAEGLGR